MDGRTRRAILFSTFDFERRGVMEEGIIRRMRRAKAGGQEGRKGKRGNCNLGNEIGEKRKEARKEARAQTQRNRRGEWSDSGFCRPSQIEHGRTRDERGVTE